METITSTNIQTLACSYGIQPSWHDMWGETHEVSDKTCQAILSAMGVTADSPQHLQQALATCKANAVARIIDHVTVVSETEGFVDITINVPTPEKDALHIWQLTLENGDIQEGSFRPGDLPLLQETMVDGQPIASYHYHFDSLPSQGYHHFTIWSAEHGDKHMMLLVVTPTKCFLPVILDQNNSDFHGNDPAQAAKSSRVWGVALQLYAVNSDRNWGIGDFTDLLTMVEWSAEKSASLVGLNPLHALFPHKPDHCSPYSPSSRSYFNALYLDPEAIPEFSESQEARQLTLSSDYQEAFRQLRSEELIDYVKIATLKWPVLEMLYQTFRTRHRLHHTERSREFERFGESQGHALQSFALYEALQEHFQNEDASIWGWPVWPKAYQHPEGEAVQEFRSRNAERIEYYQYLQWQIEEQLSLVGKRCLERSLGVGLYFDVAVGLNRGSADVWMNQSLYAQTCAVGAPPDDYNLKGQDWDLPPIIPQKLKEQQYATFIHMLRQNMRHAGALRIDHVMGLMRLFWIPSNSLPTVGAYVHYDYNDLFGILALESQRNECMVIGEDLGTVPDAIQDCMEKWGVYSYKTFFSEKDNEDSFKSPDDYQVSAAVAVSTHDLPTLTGFWQGQDLRIRTELDLFPSRELEEQQVRGRVMDRMGILNLLDQNGLLPADVTTDPQTIPLITSDLATAIHHCVARAKSKVMLVQFEDMVQQLDQINMPGISERLYPNWCRRLPFALDQLMADIRVKAITQVIAQERPILKTFPVPKQKKKRSAPLANIPRATYRFQFNKDFTFRQATELIPYFSQLGISHCYASPILKARTGSMHGYDIVDHRMINPEIGTFEDFEHFASALKEHGMFLLLDIVPNHMGADVGNPWWMDVLENGPASLYSDYFDIDWHPLTDDLKNKVLLPILGNAYGNVLKTGELQLRLDQESGRLWLDYYETAIPINPNSYPSVLSHRSDVLEARLGKDNERLLEYQSIILALQNLPIALNGEAQQKKIRIWERKVALKRLSTLLSESYEILNFIRENLSDFQFKGDDSTTLLRLNRLLEQQSYRLSNWRVASDEINYRRFFDVDSLIGVRVEDLRVFNDTHSFVMDLIEKGYVHGLRIDHPDGLYDPASYFQSLQIETERRLMSQSGSKTWRLSSSELPLYVLIEKILAPFERLPGNWAVHGTSGYEFVNAVTAVFVDQSNEQQFSQLYGDFIERNVKFDELVYYCKKLIMRTALNGELGGLANRLSQLCKYNWSTQDFTLHNLRSALIEVVASFPVYRTYSTGEGHVSGKDTEYIEWAIRVAKRKNPVTDPSIFDFIQGVLLFTFQVEGYSLKAQEAAETLTKTQAEDIQVTFWNLLTDVVLKFQQYTGPVMAKGLEDTAFYRFNRLIALNEVGGEPQQFGISVSAFHHQNQDRQKRTPHNLLASSTHDTKRSEDTRARISVLSEMPDQWAYYVRRWQSFNRHRRTELEEQDFVPSLNAEYHFYQTLLGIWPLHMPDQEELNTLASRLETYMLKAEREAKAHTSWINTNQPYEDALTQFIRQVVTHPSEQFMEDFNALHRVVSRFGLYNALSQTVLKLTSPGVPDLYQGTELWDFSLVDPDNRRPVNYELRQSVLDYVQSMLDGRDSEQFCDTLDDLMNTLEDGRIKAYTIAAILKYRSDFPEVFSRGKYVPLEISGSSAHHLIAFARVAKQDSALIVVPRLLFTKAIPEDSLPCGKAIWQDTTLCLPSSLVQTQYVGVLDGQTIPIQGSILPVASLFKHLPMAVGKLIP